MHSISSRDDPSALLIRTGWQVLTVCVNRCTAGHLNESNTGSDTNGVIRVKTGTPPRIGAGRKQQRQQQQQQLPAQPSRAASAGCSLQGQHTPSLALSNAQCLGKSCCTPSTAPMGVSGVLCGCSGSAVHLGAHCCCNPVYSGEQAAQQWHLWY